MRVADRSLEAGNLVDRCLSRNRRRDERLVIQKLRNRLLYPIPLVGSRSVEGLNLNQHAERIDQGQDVEVMFIDDSTCTREESCETLHDGLVTAEPVGADSRCRSRRLRIDVRRSLDLVKRFG